MFAESYPNISSEHAIGHQNEKIPPFKMVRNVNLVNIICIGMFWGNKGSNVSNYYVLNLKYQSDEQFSHYKSHMAR